MGFVPWHISIWRLILGQSERLSSKGIQAGEERLGRCLGRGGGQPEFRRQPPLPFPRTGGGWVSAAGSLVGGQRIWALGWMLFSWRAGSGWISGSGPQVSWCALLSQAFFPWSREEPAHWGSTLHQQWPQRAERAGIQVFLPAMGILIGL